MQETRTPVIRPATPKEEIESLHFIERWLLRLFEFMSSVKLALALMVWLVVESVLGTWVEVQFNRNVAWYFVYGAFRFHILMALLAMNVFCAALIRFPWKRYQVGFLVTHTGLLILLFGSLLTARDNTDHLMSVAKNESVNEIVDPNTKQLSIEVAELGQVRPRELASEIWPANFGPLTWGQKILFGWRRWQPDRIDEFPVKSGETVRILRYYAHCIPETIFVPDPQSRHAALRYRLAGSGRFNYDRWLEIKDEAPATEPFMGLAELHAWKFADPAAFDHFALAGPKNPDDLAGKGAVALSRRGKHAWVKVDELAKGAKILEALGARIELIEFMPNAVINPEKNELVNRGTQLGNPGIKVRVTGLEPDAKPVAIASLASFHEFNHLLGRRFSAEYFITYFRGDIGTKMYLAMAPDGRLAYRVFSGSAGMNYNGLIQPGKPGPAFAGATLTIEEALPNAAPDAQIIPKPIPRGENALNSAIDVEIVSHDGKDRVVTSLFAGDPQTRRRTLGKRRIALRYDIARRTVPFTVRLDSFEEPKDPGTNKAAMYTSNVTVTDAVTGKKIQQKITMNAPLDYAAADGNRYTLFQSGIDWSTGTPISTYSVARDPGLITKYVGCVVLCLGILLMFYMGGYFRGGARSTADDLHPTAEIKD